MPANKSAKAALSSLALGGGSSDLTLVVKGNSIETGKYVPKADAQVEPELRFSSVDPEKTYLAVMLDTEGPFPSFNVLSPILHWIQPGLKSTGDTLTSRDPFICDYAGPGPPPGSAPHQYAVFLYEQPATFDAKKFTPPNGQKTGIGKRVRFDLDAFEKEAGLGKIIACSYFRSN